MNDIPNWARGVAMICLALIPLWIGGTLVLITYFESRGRRQMRGDDDE